MKLSKQGLLSVFVIAGAFSVLTTQAFAHGYGEKHGKGGFDPAQKADKMKQDLNLSDEQTAKIKTILEAKKAQKEAEFKQNMEKMKADHQATHDQIAAVLTDEQRQKFETILKEQEQKMKEKMAEWKKNHENEEKAE